MRGRVLYDIVSAETVLFVQGVIVMVGFSGIQPMVRPSSVHFGGAQNNDVTVHATRNGNAHDYGSIGKLLGRERGFGALGGAAAVVINQENQGRLWEFLRDDAALKQSVDFSKHGVIVAVAPESISGSPPANLESLTFENGRLNLNISVNRPQGATTAVMGNPWVLAVVDKSWLDKSRFAPSVKLVAPARPAESTPADKTPAWVLSLKDGTEQDKNLSRKDRIALSQLQTERFVERVSQWLEKNNLSDQVTLNPMKALKIVMIKADREAAMRLKEAFRDEIEHFEEEVKHHL